MSCHTKLGQIHTFSLLPVSDVPSRVSGRPVMASAVQQHTSILFCSSSSEGLASLEGPAPVTPACTEGVPVRTPAALLVEVIPCLRSQGGRAFPGTASWPSALPPSAPETKEAKSVLLTSHTVVVLAGQPHISLACTVWSCYCMSMAKVTWGRQTSLEMTD